MTVTSESEDEDQGDLESGCKTCSPKSNPDKMIYTLKELKKKEHLFYVKRDFIRYGYRAHEDMNFKRCTSSLCMVHNETMNIYSHLIPGIYFIV